MQAAKKRALEKKLKKLNAEARYKNPAPHNRSDSDSDIGNSESKNTPSFSFQNSELVTDFGYDSKASVLKSETLAMQHSSKNSSPESHDEEQNDEEDSADYRIGGYHLVNLGDKFKDGRYTIIRKLGWGHFSTVWLAYDAKTDRHVALKILKSAPHYTQAARDEIKLCRRATDSNRSDPGYDHVVQLLDYFDHKGPNGIHVCMVFEVLGENLLSLLRNSKSYWKKLASHEHEANKKISDTRMQGLPIFIVKQISKQILLALDYLHTSCRIIHTDLKPENVMICFPNVELIIRNEIKRGGYQDLTRAPLPGHNSQSSELINSNQQASNVDSHSIRSSNSSNSLSSSTSNKSKSKNAIFNLQVKIADLGNATWVEHHFTESIQTRQYRSPEVIIGAQWNSSADIWSCACLIFELLTGDYLFEPVNGSKFDKDEDHLALIMERISPIPKKLALSGRFSNDFFNKKGELLHIPKLDPQPLYDILIDKHFSKSEAKQISSFLLPMLDINPLRLVVASTLLDNQEKTVGVILAL
ncbi:hypothetical protein BB560_000121 [Smittium megazygosporum]|uniref:non-specific serine/threonine protein kinase n=1 Tax=Smittium megazygosporum TaxID=133381 RepID=A0A2T9ZLC9_9FUNG|nr:hypothetical protein BB560_000121 [Smittium megazygosporum]